MKTRRNDTRLFEHGKKSRKESFLKRIISNAKRSSRKNLSNFSYITTAAKKVYKKIRKYDFNDLILATFCLNLWRRNRSALAQGLTLHMALCMDKPFGNQAIRTYSEFQTFYKEIARFLSITRMEDYVIDDYGEVFINHREENYPVIIGTGHLQVYSTLRYLQTLSEMCNADEELLSLLEYVKTIITCTKEANLPNNELAIVYELPSESFWVTVKALFANTSFQEQCNVVSKIMGWQEKPIESKHFVKKGETYYPLYNGGILIDYYKHLLSISSESIKHDHVVKTIHSLLENSFNLADKAPNRTLISPRALSVDLKEKVLFNNLLFATATKDGIVIGIDRSEFDNTLDIEEAINKIEGEQKKNGLCLIEPFYRNLKQGACGLKVEPSSAVTYIVVDSFTDIASHDDRLEREAEKWFNCTALDLLYLIGFSENFQEIVEYIRFEQNDKTAIFSFGGKSNHFFTWKASNRVIAAGAFDPDFLHLDFNETERATYSFFSETLREFPQTGRGLFRDPLNWKFGDEKLGYCSIHHKGCYGFGGEVKQLCAGLYVFLAHNIEFFTKADIEQNTHTALKIIDELNQRLFSRYSDLLTRFGFLKGKILQVLFVPWNYAQNDLEGDIVSDTTRRIVFSDEYVERDSVIVRYSVDTSRLMDELQNATDRAIENCYFKELLMPLAKYDPENFKLLDEKLAEDSRLKKTVGVFQIQQYYYFSDWAVDTDISAISLTKVRKEIAKVCMASGIIPGEYRGREATEVIRKMQLSIVELFEQTISQFEKWDLHYKALNYYAIQQNGIIMNAKRYKAFEDLDDEIQLEFEQGTRQIREEYRKNAETIKYLLETNLFIDHVEGAPSCSNDDFEFLLAFADWLIVLQDDADMCHHRDPNYTISVRADYRVDPILSEELKQQYENILLRKYATDDYHIKNDDRDQDFLQKAIVAFKKDTGVDLPLLLTLIEYMQLGVVQDELAKEVYPNVFQISKAYLEKGFFDALQDQIYEPGDIAKAIDFLVLDAKLLKVVDGQIHEVLPVWEREKRENRFSIKPVIMDGDNCIFSPVIMNHILTSWKSGITEWFLPYEIGLSNLKNVLKQWKKRYEDEMVQDIAKIFAEKDTYTVFPEVDLFKRFPNENYPEQLGDYDVLAICEEKKEIWLIESKVLQKVGSIYEAQMQQKSFFLQHREDEKFQRRIDFMKKNTSKILASFGIADAQYKIIPYMVTNKLFESRYKKIAFPIVTLDELCALLDENDA